jgi:hypothetical protein
VSAVTKGSSKTASGLKSACDKLGLRRLGAESTASRTGRDDVWMTGYAEVIPCPEVSFWEVEWVHSGRIRSPLGKPAKQQNRQGIATNLREGFVTGSKSIGSIWVPFT